MICVHVVCKILLNGLFEHSTIFTSKRIVLFFVQSNKSDCQSFQKKQVTFRVLQATWILYIVS